MNVLITGAAGKVGRCIADGLKQRHRIRGLDVAPMPDVEDSIVGDLGDLGTLADPRETAQALVAELAPKTDVIVLLSALGLREGTGLWRRPGTPPG